MWAAWRFEEALKNSENSSTSNTSFIERLNLTIRHLVKLFKIRLDLELAIVLLNPHGACRVSWAHGGHMMDRWYQPPSPPCAPYRAGSPEVEGECASGALWDPNRARRWRAGSCLGRVRDAWSGPAPRDAAWRRKSLSVANLTGAAAKALGVSA